MRTLSPTGDKEEAQPDAATDMFKDLQNQSKGYDHLNFNICYDTEYKIYDMANDIDPGNHLYSTININCEYYTENDFNNQVKTDDA